METGKTLRTELCVVGSGAAGMSVALEYAAAGGSVIMLEAGGDEFDGRSQTFYEGTTSGHFGLDVLTTHRLRQLGGSTNIWAGHCCPLDPIDFQERSWVRNSGWPITWEEIQPWYRRAARVLKLPTRPGPDAPSEFGAGFQPLGSRLKPRFYRVSPLNFSQAYRRELRSSPRITTLLQAPVFKLRRDANRSRLERIEVSRDGAAGFSVEADTYVLATGGIENARLLLLNGIGSRAVGGYLTSHLSPRTFFSPPGELEGALRRCDSFGASRADRGLVKFAFSEEFSKRHQLGNVHFWPMAPWQARRAIPAALAFTSRQAGLVSALGAHCEQAPGPKNQVTLGEGKDPFGNPQPHVHWLQRKTDVNQAATELMTAGRMLSAEGAGRVFWPEADRKTRHWTRGHHIGTTRMNDHPKRGVVDRNCRVHGLDNLYIAGSSVFATAGSANPTYTIVALACRLAEHLAERRGAA